jgi:hypothetical protein
VTRQVEEGEGHVYEGRKAVVVRGPGIPLRRASIGLKELYIQVAISSVCSNRVYRFDFANRNHGYGNHCFFRILIRDAFEVECLK